MIELNNNNFDEIVLQDNKTILVDIYSTTCGPCKILLPIIEQISNEVNDDIIICKLNTEDIKDSDILQRYMVRNVPTLLYFNNGELINKTVGLVTKESILNKLENK